MGGFFLPTMLLLLAFGLLLSEMLFASGALALLAGLVYLLSVGVAFWATGLAGGAIFFVLSLLGTGVVVVSLVKWAPRSSFGRNIFAQPPRLDQLEAHRSHLAQLVGRHGTARCEMLPGGIVNIDGTNYDAISESGAIDTGDTVRVVAVRERTLLVRKAQTPAALQETTSGPGESPFESLVLDPFDDTRSPGTP